jgi:hypothetical protein
MAVVKEKNGFRRTTGRFEERIYAITQATDPDSARSAMLFSSECPTTVTVDGIQYIRDNTECGVDEIFTVGNGSGGIARAIYIGRAVWKIPDFGPIPANSFTLSFDISGQTTRVTQARAHIARYSASGKDQTDTKNFLGAINVQDDGTVEGTDVAVPYFTYVVNYCFEAADVTQAFILTLSNIVGTSNLYPFHGFDGGELLLYRVSGQKRVDGNWDIAFAFAVSRNAQNLNVGNGILVDDKLGWDYLWVYYEERKDASLNFVHKVPIAAYVEQVYFYKDYSVLNI